MGQPVRSHFKLVFIFKIINNHQLDNFIEELVIYFISTSMDLKISFEAEENFISIFIRLLSLDSQWTTIYKNKQK